VIDLVSRTWETLISDRPVGGVDERVVTERARAAEGELHVIPVRPCLELVERRLRGVADADLLPQPVRS
jgi:hypothetical protein